MSKVRAESPCRNIGRIRIRTSLISGGRDSKIFSIEMSLIKIIRIGMLRMIPRKKTPWEKGEDHQSSVEDAKRITCKRISHMERIE